MLHVCMLHVCMLHECTMHAAESKARLLPLYVALLKRHLLSKVELRLCASILSEILLSLHADLRLVCTLPPSILPPSLLLSVWGMAYA